MQGPSTFTIGSGKSPTPLTCPAAKRIDQIERIVKEMSAGF